MLFSPALDRARAIPGFAAGWERWGDQPALLSGSQIVSYADLQLRVDAFAHRLGGGRRLVLLVPQNTVDGVVAYLAAIRAGHVAMLVPDGPHLATLIDRYDPDVLVQDGQITERRSGSAHDLHPDLALLLSTSGSTGSPKLVRLSQENLHTNAEVIAGYLDIRPTDRAMLSLPMTYCYGLSVIHSHLASGAAVVVTDLSVVDRCFWSLFTSVGATTFAAVPYTFELLDRVGFADLDLPSLRYITQAGGALAPERVQEFAALGERNGWQLVVMYGQTEATARMAYLPPDFAASRPNAIGIPIPGGSFDLTAHGELVYRGPNVMLGYAHGPADLSLGRTVHELHTGDLARRTPDGLYEVVGRSSRFLKLCGLRIDLDRIERTLAEDGIHAVCTGDDRGLVVAVRSAGSVNGASAVIQRLVGLSPAQVRVAAFEQMPRLANGKPDYQAIRRGMPADELRVVSVHDLYRELLGVASVEDGDTFVSLGGDSLSYVECSIRLEELLGHLPDGWHLVPVGQLRPGTRSRFTRQVEMGVLLRAAAIVVIVAKHVGLISLMGGAHVLLAIAGFSFARFQVNATRASDRVRPMLGTIARIAVPSMIIIAGAAYFTPDYDLTNVLLLNHYFGEPSWSPHWDYWYVEAIVEILLVLAVLLAISAVRRWERAVPFGFALAMLAVGLAISFNPLNSDLALVASRPHTTFWFFALGWAAERARHNRDKVLLSFVVVAFVPPFFDFPMRSYVVMTGLLALIWISRVRVPAPLHRVLGVLAGASLYIYLTQWQTFPWLLEHGVGKFETTLLALGIGVGTWLVVERATALGTHAFRRRGATPTRAATYVPATGRT